ncbi:CBS domain-containing protein [Fimbriimonas ginsengisoli]|uniref:Putative CBS domain protein n=1 Tax=Fimbriimonas ginsengisoli Gsoil 348 TaxID=661478 RepID=A0A068NWZ1_FIMGI|nr:CBS domain-containing protein [Fimbriimonas ginsengisoli]AIE87956.1 putative CBS domain protein [Fimbriimonas ginsengisoli Gsoil 348]
MTSGPACCQADTMIQEAAKMMIERDCGAIPVVDGGDHSMRVIGLITDRDITVRAVAAGKDPGQTAVREAMSHPVATINKSASLDECLHLMEQNQVRRMPVVDGSGCLVGIVAQADIARQPDGKVAELVQEVSKGFDSGHA